MKLLPDGRCGLFVKRKTVEEEKPGAIGLRTGAGMRAKKKLDKLGL